MKFARLKICALSLLSVAAILAPSNIADAGAWTKKGPKPQALKKTKLTPAQKQAAYVARMVKTGKKLFNANDCKACHSVEGDGCKDGPQLDGIGSRRTKEFIVEQLSDPEAHVRKHAGEFGNDPNMMPDMQLSKRDIEAIALYLMSTPKRAPEPAQSAEQK